MIFAGVAFGKDGTSSTIVLVRMRRINVKRHYFIEDAQTHFLAETGDAIATLRDDTKYCIRKRVFSQDRRPAKSVSVKPLIVAEFSDGYPSQIDSLRKRGIPVEGISVQAEPGWRKEDHPRACVGDNYFVSRDALADNLRMLLHEERLSIAGETELPKELITDLDRLRNEKVLCDDKSVLALAMPLWFRETIRIVRRY